ncbi:MAG: class I SAM-dependent methyltransferase [Desulfobacterales bacterium]|nr:class I SAM-dependent methyltransferase [Desulfobacterales bacterium]
MGYVFDFKDAGEYDGGLETPMNRYCHDLEIKLLMKMLDPKPGQRILDIGCGTGISLVPLLDSKLGRLDLTGIDPSPYMLDLAYERLGDRVDLHRGAAEDLPFDDNAFETAFFFTSLEYTERPAKAIEEACRVAKDQVIIGVYNRHAPLNLYRRLKGYFFSGRFSHARFFGIWELKRMMSNILGRVPVTWRTTLQCPFIRGKWPARIENYGLVQRFYFGTFIAMRIKPVPTFRTRPLSLKVRARKLYHPNRGLVTGYRAGE